MTSKEAYKLWVAQIDARHAAIKQEIIATEHCDPDSACVRAWAMVVEEVRLRREKIVEKYGDGK